MGAPMMVWLSLSALEKSGCIGFLTGGNEEN